MTKTIAIPELSLVMLVGPSGSGKTSFAAKHFKSTEVLSSDYCRGLISDDENDQTVTKDAFEVLNFIAAKRLAAGKLVVVDATNVQPEARKPLIELARRHHVLPVALVLNLPEDVCVERNKKRPDRNFGKRFIWNQIDQLRRSFKHIKHEGVSHVYSLNSVEEVDNVVITRVPLWNNLKHEKGPFDIVGDVHGCFDELHALMLKLGYEIRKGEAYEVSHPENRKLIFVGDLVDRGPKTPEVLRIVMDMVATGRAFCVNGNHDEKLRKKLEGRDVKVAHGLAESLEQLAQESEEFRTKASAFLKDLIAHFVFDDGKLAVAHAGIKEKYIGRGSPRIRDFCMYGETTGEIDEFGLPVRYPWARDYRGETMVVYGHTPVPEPEWVNNTINIDTGCVFGAKLTALRYPERELVDVNAAQVYCEPIRPLGYSKELGAADTVLDIKDVIGRRTITTSLARNIIIAEGNALAALEAMSRFAIDPRWLIYAPPTMSPTETSELDGMLEHPQEALEYFRKQGVRELICEEKHMGSRAIVVVCKNQSTAHKRFGVSGDEIGVCYTRTGRAFFNDAELSNAFLQRIALAINSAGLWEEFDTDWFCLDGEILPWSAKAMGLLEQQYAPVGASANQSLSDVVSVLEKTAARVKDAQGLHDRFVSRLEMVSLYRDSYRRYCWPVAGLEDYRFAPFHVLASENSFNMDKDHLWHMNVINRLCDAGPDLLKKTAYRVVDVDDEQSCSEAITWWSDLTARGGEGMVVKPMAFTVKGKKGLCQPGVKCRGREYLRIIYGPEYTAPENLVRLRSRGLSKKRMLAIQEYALGYEALKRFVKKEPLYRVHEAVFGVLALESEPVDPRL